MQEKPHKRSAKEEQSGQAVEKKYKRSVGPMSPISFEDTKRLVLKCCNCDANSVPFYVFCSTCWGDICEKCKVTLCRDCDNMKKYKGICPTCNKKNCQGARKLYLCLSKTTTWSPDPKPDKCPLANTRTGAFGSGVVDGCRMESDGDCLAWCDKCRRHTRTKLLEYAPDHATDEMAEMVDPCDC